MKITPLQYARVLFEVTNGKEREKQKECVISFVKILRRYHHIRYVHRIIYFYEDICNRELEYSRIDLYSHSFLEESQRDQLRSILKTQYTKSGNVSLEEQKNEKILGGFIVEIANSRYERSIASVLGQFREYVEKK
ncbi:MAG: hypothetical protein EOM19_08600 [Candidatus Moranbacteria bacterium]|nr:hypothetical protein [Candidatus Moranbacteria bacterium]